MAKLSVLILFLAMIVADVHANWLRARNVQWQGTMGTEPRAQMRNIKKTFLPPRYQNLWGQGESSKVVGNSALAAQNMDDYKMQTQQRQVFSWQPSSAFMDW